MICLGRLGGDWGNMETMLFNIISGNIMLMLLLLLLLLFINYFMIIIILGGVTPAQTTAWGLRLTYTTFYFIYLAPVMQHEHENSSAKVKCQRQTMIIIITSGNSVLPFDLLLHAYIPYIPYMP